MKIKVCLLTGEFNIFSGRSKPMFKLAKNLLKVVLEYTLVLKKVVIKL